MAIGVFFSDFGVGLYETLRDLQRATDPFVLGSYFNGWIEIFLFLGLVGAPAWLRLRWVLTVHCTVCDARSTSPSLGLQ